MNRLPRSPREYLQRDHARSIVGQLCRVVLIVSYLTVLSMAEGRLAEPSSATLDHFFASQETAANLLPPKEAERIIALRARAALLALKTGNIGRFATFVHPQKGVRFSPYASVLPEEDRVVKRNQLTGMWASSRRYNWGSYDGSGDPIRLTFRKYHRQFIFDHDFSRAKEVRYNGESMGHATTINNIRDSYPATITVEHFFPGFDEKRSGMDWSSLWLVFEKRGGDWFLVGVVHNEWTI